MHALYFSKYYNLQGSKGRRGQGGAGFAGWRHFGVGMNFLREIFQKRAKGGEALLTTPCSRFMRECAGLKPEQGTT